MTTRHRTLSRLVVGLASLAVLWLCSPPLLVAAIRNEQITWSGTAIGLIPRVRGIAPRLLFWRGRACVPFLRRALNDDDRYVAAHVYLTMLEPEGFSTGSEAFNGLWVILEANGRTVIPPEQKSRLIEHWSSEE